MQNKNPLLKKIVILFISLLIPILLIGMYTVRKGNEKLKHEIISSIHTNNQTYISQLDTTLRQIYFSNVSVLNQNFIPKLAYLSSFMSDYERGVLINLLREQLSSICNTHPFLESAQFFFRTTNRIYNSNGYHLGSFQQITEGYENILDEFQRSSGTIHYYTNPITHQQDLSIFSTPSFSNSDYGMILTLSQTELQNYLESNAAYLHDYYILNIDHDFTLTNLPESLYEEGQALIPLLQTEDTLDTYKLIHLNNSHYYAFSYTLPYSKGTYIRFISTQAFLNQLKLTPLLLNMLFIAVAIACIAFFIGIYRLVHKPLRQLIDAFVEVEQGNFNVYIKENKKSDLAYLYSAFNKMTIQLKQLIERDYTQKMLLQKAELKQLQAQINPHFLYNSFFMLQRMIKMDLSEEALEVANALGIYFRYITKNSMDYVTLREEYEHTKTYAYIQGLRFEGRIDVLFEDLPVDCESITVPKLILQPIVENAFNYGLNDKLENGLLKVSFMNYAEYLKITIEENGEGISDDKLFELQSKLLISKGSSSEFEMSGILNIQRRLVVFSNNLSSLDVSRSDLGGLRVTITLSKTYS